MEIVFCILFTGEIVVRWFSYKRPKFFFIDPDMWKWNLFDATLVLLMVVEVCILSWAVTGKGRAEHEVVSGCPVCRKLGG